MRTSGVSGDSTDNQTRTKDLAESETFILFWVYGDGENSPYTLRNPPENLEALLTEWTELERRYVDDQPGAADEWQPVNEWLKTKGVDIIEPAGQVTLRKWRH
jgi:hypothetical protein